MMIDEIDIHLNQLLITFYKLLVAVVPWLVINCSARTVIISFTTYQSLHWFE